ADGGILAADGELSAPPRASVKLLATAAEALERSGLAARERIAAIRSWSRFLVMVKRTAFTRGEIAAIRTFCAERSFDVVYYAGMPESEANRFNLLDQPVLFRAAQALIGPSRQEFVRDYKLHVAPATDDRPYFFRSFRWRSLAELLRLRTRGGAALVEWSYILLVAALAQAVLAGLVLILLPLWLIRRRSIAGASRVGLYFLCLGLAFLFLEIAFIQHLTRFLAHPLLAVAVVLTGFLFFAGLGSGASQWLERRWPRAPIRLAVGAIVLTVLLCVALSTVLFTRCAAWSPWLKVPLALLAIAPLAFFLGMPFPLGLRRVAAEQPDLVPWAWGVNGWASVLSAVLATLLAVHLGFTAVVVVACGLYVVAGLAAPHAAR
ncbi:MAG: SAM-dependent methyltransferase, partial [Acidobacteria bacterium]|nr:SAM-dependent methyltransferase [Acidobacteriota bacterium]